uniref:Uncharacterized protein n=1 Tax=Astyanax mexicanus TaxID=7994 RepID=A0A3B1IQA6_ASTMX
MRQRVSAPTSLTRFRPRLTQPKALQEEGGSAPPQKKGAGPMRSASLSSSLFSAIQWRGAAVSLARPEESLLPVGGLRVTVAEEQLSPAFKIRRQEPRHRNRGTLVQTKRHRPRPGSFKLNKKAARQEKPAAKYEPSPNGLRSLRKRPRTLFAAAAKKGNHPEPQRSRKKPALPEATQSPKNSPRLSSPKAAQSQRSAKPTEGLPQDRKAKVKKIICKKINY